MLASDPAATLIAGLGGACGDDRAGWHVIDLMDANLAATVRTQLRLEKLASPADLLNLLGVCDQLILIDACQGLTEAGRVVQIRWPAHGLLQTRHSFGHNLSLSQVLETAAQVGALPAHCDLWCVEGAQFEFEQPLTPCVAAAADRLAKTFVASLAPASR
jgi:hydrogenase maturation protease